MAKQSQELSYGIKPFWFWNGDMDDNEITRQVKEMSDKGIGGFFVHSRQGLEIPYLSEKYFEKVGVALEGARKYGVEMWLYDEYPYPSGISGGEVVLENPAHKAVYLVNKAVNVDGGTEVNMELPWGKIVLAAAYPVINGETVWENPLDITEYAGVGHREKIFQLSGLTAYNNKRFFTGDLCWKLQWKAPHGQWHICVFSERFVENFKYFGNFVDTFNPEAVKCFIRTTHEKYKKHFGHEFGKTIKGIFTDETSPMGGIPWSPILREEFKKRNGYDIVQRLPALTEAMGNDTAKVRYDFRNTVVNMFIESYDVQIHNWCMDNNLIYTGEKPILRSSQFQNIDIPGIDAGHTKAGDRPDIASAKYRANGKLLSSAVHFYGKQRAVCECYHSIGWSATHQDLKCIIDWLAVQGVDMFVPHAFFYTTDALAKHDAPPSAFYQMPLWKHTGDFSRYVTELGSTLGRFKRKVKVLIIDPVTSTWTAGGGRMSLGGKLSQEFHVLQENLLRNHIDYYIVDPQLLSECSISNGSIHVRSKYMDKGEDYDILLIPPVTNLEGGALKIIEEFHADGGKIIATGCLPVERIEENYDSKAAIDRIFGTDCSIIYDRYITKEIKSGEAISIRNRNAIFVERVNDVCSVLQEVLKKDIYITSDGAENSDILTSLYSGEGSELCFAVNTSAQDCHAEISIRHAGADISGAYRLNVGNGCSREPISYAIEKGYIKLSVDLKRFESLLVIIDSVSTDAIQCCSINNAGSASGSVSNMQSVEKDGSLKILTLDTRGQWNMRAKNMNALRLDDWKLNIQNADNYEYKFCTESSDTVKSMPVIDQIAFGHIPLPISLGNHFGSPKELQFIPMNCTYTKEFIVDTKPEKIWLVMEPGSISGSWSMRINGHEIHSGDFKNKGIYMPTNLAVEISEYITPGKNNIEIAVKILRTFDGVVNPLYLFGDFGVYKADKETSTWRIGELMQLGSIGQLKECGLPFYAGEIIYSREVEMDIIEGTGRYAVAIDNPSIQQNVDMYVNGKSVGVRSWCPYEWKLETECLKNGANAVELHITTGMLGLFEGQYMDPLEKKLENL